MCNLLSQLYDYVLQTGPDHIKIIRFLNNAVHKFDGYPIDNRLMVPLCLSILIYLRPTLDGKYIDL